MAYEIFETCMLVPGFSRGECASWVQAWGSVLAILFAPLLVIWQARQHAAADARGKQQKLLDQLTSFRMLLGQVQSLSITLAKAWGNAKFQTLDTIAGEAEVLRRVLASLSIFDVADGMFVATIALTDQRVRTLIDICHIPHWEDGDVPIIAEQIRGLIAADADALQWCEEAITTLQAKLGRKPPAT